MTDLRDRANTSVGVAGMDPVADRKSVATPRACARSCSQPFDSALTTHDAAPAARASDGRPRTDKADLPTRPGTGDTREPERLIMSWEDADQIIQDQMADIARLREAILRLAEQDATLSVCEGNVTVEIDGTLTPEEREAVGRAAQWMVQLAKDRGEIHSAGYFVDDAATLRNLLERLK